MYYRVANRPDASSCWRWESRVIASLEVLVRVLWMYRSMPRHHLRVFFSSSIEGLDLMLERENTGLASNSIPVDHLLDGRWSISQSISQLEMRQFEAELRTRERGGMGETSTVGEQALYEQRRSTPPEGSLHVLDSRRLEVERGTPGDHDTLYTFSFPSSLPQTLAWLKLLARAQQEEFQS
jgi:hypothetical protein